MFVKQITGTFIKLGKCNNPFSKVIGCFLVHLIAPCFHARTDCTKIFKHRLSIRSENFVFLIRMNGIYSRVVNMLKFDT